MARTVQSRKTRWALILIAGLGLAGCGMFRGPSVDRIHTTQKPTNQTEIDKANEEFEAISDEGFALKKRWTDDSGGVEVQYWHFRRPARPSDQNPHLRESAGTPAAQ